MVINAIGVEDATVLLQEEVFMKKQLQLLGEKG
jgi:hypothetical protein